MAPKKRSKSPPAKKNKSTDAAVPPSAPKSNNNSLSANPAPTGSLWWSANPRKAEIEKAWAEYTVVWCGVMGVIMLSGASSVWRDTELMTLGIAAMMGTYFYPFLRCETLHMPTLHAMFYGNVVLSFTMHYLATPFFFDVLHMRYGFIVDVRIDRNPVFLYFLTVAYFATYSVWGSVCLRRATHICQAPEWKENGLTRFVGQVCRGSCVLVVPFMLAFGETVMNANPFISDLFCYDDTYFALVFGTFAYGLGFVFSLPVWLWGVPDVPVIVSEAELRRPKSKFELFFSWDSRLWQNVFGQFFAEILHAMCLYYLRHEVAPLMTTVVNNSSPFGGCLTPYRQPIWEIAAEKWL